MVKDANSEKYGLEKIYMKDGYLDIPIESEVYTPFGRLLEKTQTIRQLNIKTYFDIITNNMVL